MQGEQPVAKGKYIYRFKWNLVDSTAKSIYMYTGAT